MIHSQPKEFYLLNFSSMWECFSYYGMRALLMLFMVKELHLSDSEAYATYALYITLIELGGVLGGILADRFLSLRGAIVIGGWAIFCGHLLLGYSGQNLTLFFLSLGLIISGTNLFRVNIPAAIGALYGQENHQQENEQRDRAFTIFYATINIGGLLATLICGILGESHGWHLGFGAAAVGMFFSNVILALRWNIRDIFCRKKIFLGLGYILVAAPLFGLSLFFALNFTTFVTCILVGAFIFIFRRIYKDNHLKILLRLIIFLVLFYGCEELLGSTFILFGERHVDRMIGGIEIPASILPILNPMIILLAGYFVAKFKATVSTKIHLSLFLLGLAFVVLYFAAGKENISLFYAISGIGMISLGELFIGPTILAESAKLSKENERGFTMSIVTLGYSAANLLSGFLSQNMADTEASSRLAFQSGFGMIAILVFLVLILSFSMRSYENQLAKA